MKKGDKLFVRIDFKNNDSDTTEKDFSDHVLYVEKVSSERFLIGGGFNNLKGGMIIFSAKNFLEAKKIAECDPLIERKKYDFDLFEWEIFITSKR